MRLTSDSNTGKNKGSGGYRQIGCLKYEFHGTNSNGDFNGAIF